jgi:voltage-gated potassium channel
MRAAESPSTAGWRQKLHTIIFEADTPAGRLFDIGLLISIVVSVLVVVLESIASMRAAYGPLLYRLEWGFTLLFTLEYVLRLLAVQQPLRYARSFFGVVDLLSIVPSYLSLVFVGSQYLLVIRILRLLRVFRVLKLTEYLLHGQVLGRALLASRYKIAVFLLTVITIVVIVGSVMYVVEGGRNEGFSNIPISIYWAVVTMATVGYGDITPQTPLGQFIAMVVILMGYGILAVPTGIVSLELVRSAQASTRSCTSCGREGHDHDAAFCKYCGEAL